MGYRQPVANPDIYGNKKYKNAYKSLKNMLIHINKYAYIYHVAKPG